MSKETTNTVVTYVKNSDLLTRSLPFEWKGTPVDKRGRFVYEDMPFVNSFRDVLKWQLSRNPQKSEKKTDHWKLQVIEDESFLTSNQDCLVWLGHASFFIRLAGVRMLIDPVLFNVSIVKRHSALPVRPESLKGIDYILISHDHRDHCDEKSLQLLAKQNPNAVFLSGLKMEEVIPKLTKRETEIQTAGWYQEYKTPSAISITYVPSRHWGRRYLTDTNVHLWGGFVLEGDGKVIYFGGDSGYGKHFEQIGKAFPGIDYSLIGVGAYKPEFFMGQSHLSPTDSLKALKDTGAKYMIPMHFGTFDLADEPLGDPLKVLQKLDEKSRGNILFPAVGDVIHL